LVQKNYRKGMMMERKKILTILLLGIIFTGSGVILIAMDYQKFKENYKKLYLNFSRTLSPTEVNESEPFPYTEEKLKSDLYMAEEYLRQNSYDSIRKALDIYNKVLSFAKDVKIKQLAKYGLAYSLYRLNDDNRSLLHLKELKTEKIFDPILEEEVDYLLGRILLLRGHDDEGRAILQNLLARTTSKDLKSRIHATFGDYYQLKKEFKKAKKSYQIALEYNPDNLHAEVIKENLDKNKELIPFEHDYYDQQLSKKTLEEKEPIKKEKDKLKDKNKDKDKDKEKGSQKLEMSEEIEKLKREFSLAVSLYNQNDLQNANNQLINLEKKVSQLLMENIKEKEKNDLYTLLENIYYRLGEVVEKQKNNELAKVYYDKVLANPSPELDQAALIKKGMIYFEQEKYKEAYNLFTRAVEISPNGKYTAKAMEWLKETEKILKNMSD
jgi:tetratricopeptide (TPR) repeat protein